MRGRVIALGLERVLAWVLAWVIARVLAGKRGRVIALGKYEEGYSLDFPS